MKSKITFLLVVAFAAISYSQVTNQGTPQSWKLETVETVKPINMPGFDLKKLQEEDVVNDVKKDRPWRFGYEFIVDHNLDNSGKWETLPNGDRIWRIRFYSEGAQTMNFLFSDFYMPKGATLYLYNNDRSDLLGAYTVSQNNDERVLGTWLVKGEDVWIEYYEPRSKKGQGKLEIFKVVHGYRTSDDFAKDPDDSLNSSGNCNYDVNCPMGDIDALKAVNKKAVALVVVNSSGYCSGALVNNTNNDQAPYFLTANHCYSNPAEWAFRFNWISPNPVCAANASSTNNTNYHQTVSGATLKAKRTESDFCLVEITQQLPSDWDLVWAGWDRSGNVPESTFGIHHPAGDIMKACRDIDPPLMNDDGFHTWYIQNWDMGVTEGGSSGSPLFDHNGRVIGQLFGGSSACTGTSNNGGFDEYGRLAVSWDTGTSITSRLKEWLDPAGISGETLDFYPPADVYGLNAQARIVDLNAESCGNAINPVIRIGNKGTQNLTAVQISYHINDNEPVTQSWTGNLAPGEGEEILLPTQQGSAGDNIFTVNLLAPNGGTDEFMADNTSARVFESHSFVADQVLLEINEDFYGEETSWDIRNAETDEVLYSGDGYGVFETTNKTLNLDAGCYVFTIYDAEGDGICCDYGDGSYSLRLPDGTVIIEGGSYGDSESVTFSLGSALSSGDFSLSGEVKIYPNPSKGIFTIAAPAPLKYQMYTTLGQLVKTGELAPGNNSTIDLGSGTDGIYILKLTDGANRSANFKLIKE